MKNLLLILIVFSSASFAGVESEVEVSTGSNGAAFGTQCIGGYLFAYAVKGGYRGSVSIQQVFKDGESLSRPNDPIKCEVK